MLTPGRVRVVALWFSDVLCVCSLWAVVASGYWALGMALRALGIANGIGGYTASLYLSFWPVPLVFGMFNGVLGLYQGSWLYPAAPLSPIEELRRLFGSSFLTHVGVIAYLGFAYQTTDGYSRVVVAASGVLVAFAAQSFRNWMRILLKRLGWGQIPVVVAGNGPTAQQLVRNLKDDSYSGFRPIGYFASAQGPVAVPYLGSLQEIVRQSRELDIKILLACQDERLFRAQLDEYASWFTYIDYIPSARAFPIFGARPVSFDGIGGIEMVNQVRMKVKRVQKRVLDMVCTIVAFALSAPLFIAIAALVKLTSRGPVFYRHARLGRNGEPIKVWKFRSMYADAEGRLAQLLENDATAAEEWKSNFKLAKDPRITRFGRFLRKTSLDELPQLINVLKGEMALVGPRPIVSAEVSYYGDSYKIFSSVKPGVTGLWQVSGRSDTDYARRVALDTYYVLNWSPWMDIWILIRTVYAVLFMRGAR